MISETSSLVSQRNRLLFYAGIGNIVLFLSCAILSLIDERMVAGTNTWFKPMKFNAAFVVFLWTFAFLLPCIPNRRKEKWIALLLFIAMVMEMIPITIQAARGTSSHFNTRSLLDESIYQVMGFFILVNTLTALYITIQFFKPTRYLSPSMKLAVQAGLILFLLGAVSGGTMVALKAHSIGVADGGAGLPFLNWSTAAGDLRVAHFVTLHALQVIPLIAIVTEKYFHITKTYVVTVAIIYSVVCVWLHYQALSGKPFIAF